MPPVIALKPTDARRLEKLAVAAGRSPAAMLPFVLKDGFDYCERTVRAVNEGLTDLAAGRSAPAEEVHRKARAIVAKHGKKAA